MNKTAIISTGAMGCALASVFLITLTGCVGEVDADYVGPDDYVYYPGYELYYGSRSHEWYYRDGDRWIAHGAPRGVTVDTLRSAPAVPMTFHDNPGSHHAEVARQYPKNWAPAGGGHDHDDRDHH
jgi:hypothetical protein